MFVQTSITPQTAKEPEEIGEVRRRGERRSDRFQQVYAESKRYVYILTVDI